MKKKEKTPFVSNDNFLLLLLGGIILLSFRNMGTFRSLAAGLILLFISLRVYSEHKGIVYLSAVIISILVILMVVPFLAPIINFLLLISGVLLLVGGIIRFFLQLFTDKKNNT